MRTRRRDPENPTNGSGSAALLVHRSQESGVRSQESGIAGIQEYRIREGGMQELNSGTPEPRNPNQAG